MAIALVLSVPAAYGIRYRVKVKCFPSYISDFTDALHPDIDPNVSDFQ